MSFLGFVATYFASEPAVVTLALLLSLLAFLFVLFRLEEYRPQRRRRILFASFAVEVLAWSFVASSLLLCRAFIGLYQTLGDVTTFRMVFGLAVLTSLAIALPLSAIVTFKVPGAIARRLAQELPEAETGVMAMARETARSLGVAFLRLLQSPSDVPFAYSVGGSEGIIVVSKGLLAHLNGDEVETVLAHEIAHLKNNDAGLNTVIAVYRRVLFFDPLIRILEGTIYIEKEFSADELSARKTQKPLSLASALLKISVAQSGGRGLSVRTEGLSILGSNKILRPPSVKERIERLMKLATELDREADAQSRALRAS